MGNEIKNDTLSRLNSGFLPEHPRTTFRKHRKNAAHWDFRAHEAFRGRLLGRPHLQQRQGPFHSLSRPTHLQSPKNRDLRRKINTAYKQDWEGRRAEWVWGWGDIPFGCSLFRVRGGREKNKTNFKSSCCSRLQKRFGMLGGCKRNKANVEGGNGRPIKFLATRQETYHYHMI